MEALVWVARGLPVTILLLARYSLAAHPPFFNASRVLDLGAAVLFFFCFSFPALAKTPHTTSHRSVAEGALHVSCRAPRAIGIGVSFGVDPTAQCVAQGMYLDPARLTCEPCGANQKVGANNSFEHCEYEFKCAWYFSLVVACVRCIEVGGRHETQRAILFPSSLAGC